MHFTILTLDTIQQAVVLFHQQDFLLVVIQQMNISLDDNGEGIVRLYYVQAGERVYVDSTAGTINYATGEFYRIIFITTISDVDGAASTAIRITVIPNSKDIVPVRNQILEIDFTNSTVTGAG